MQGQGRGTIHPPLGIALDGDFGHRLDALLAISMLSGFAAKGEARQIALCSSRNGLKAAQLADVVSGFYAGRPVVGMRGAVGATPQGMVGMPEAGRVDEAPPLAAILAKKSPDGSAVYRSGIASVRDTAENAVLVRNVLLAQFDANAVIVLAGPASGLAGLTTLYGARPQISAKARELVVACGSYPSGAADPSIAADVAAARKLFADWPTPIAAVGSEVGAALAYSGASFDTDFAWAPTHPLVDAYRVRAAGPQDVPASALAALLYAVHPDAGYFKVSESGMVSVLDDGRTQFTPGRGTHRYLIVDPAQTDRVTKLLRDLVSAQPPARPGRRGGD
jgi:hypothetical protein